ncbi:hypothetical protein DE146DRAFT_664237 [Phaeosphaeria sp. MPI-PUGE-AT-0046c]|nr:hypothetical protein DE146DRAFT_664237 [Phaeosphaeria sp. MPI-PUGE-AT-0046c]
MPRLTRAQRAKQDVDETVPNATEAVERSPLNEISPNASPEQVAPVEELPKKTPARSKSKKGAKKGAKAKKGKAVEEEQVEIEVNDDQQDVDMPGSDEVADNAIQDPVTEQVPEDTSTTVNTNTIPQVAEEHAVPEERPASPPAKAVRLTRRQLAKQEEELRQSQRAISPLPQLEVEPATEDVAQPPIEQTQEEDIVQNVDNVPQLEEANADIEEAEKENEIVDQEPELEQQQEPMNTAQPENAVLEAEEDRSIQAREEAGSQLKQCASVESVTLPAEAQRVDESEAETIAPSLEVTSEPEPKTLAAERPSDASRTPTMSRTPSRRASRSPSKSPMRIEESIEALDALEEALENVGKAVSHFDQGTEASSPHKKAFPKGANAPSAQTKTPRKTPLATRVSRTPSAAPKSIKPTTSSLARASSVRVAPKELRKGSADTTDYLASKRRPVSVSFPTPPPPPKGRAPTKPTFQLSSEVVAAKLKAQKEERLKREAEREAGGVVAKPRPISMPPVVKSTKAPTKPTFQLSSDAVTARLKAQKEARLEREAESAQNGQPKARPVSISMAPPTVKSSKPPTKANFQLPGEAVAAKLKAQREERAKREEEAEAAKKAAAAARPRPTTVRKPVAPTRAQPGVTIPPPPPRQDSLHPPAQRSISTSSSKRNSIQMSRSTSASTNASNRNSTIVPKTVVTPVDVVQQKFSGKEVFNRDKMEKDAKDRERREKEEAAKQARAQAAERGRAASREWAERQRQKMVNAVRAKAEAA